MSQEITDLLASDVEKIVRTKGLRTIPGATVTLEQWEKLFDETDELFGKLARTSLLHFGFLGDTWPEQITLCPPSKGLTEVNTEKLLEALTAVENQVSVLQAQFADKANWTEFSKRVSRLRKAWTEFAASDFTNEQVVENVNITLKGPKLVVERIIELIRTTVDQETVKALNGQRVSFVPQLSGDMPIVLHDQGGPFPLFATGDEVKNLLQAMGVTIVPAEEMEQFAKDWLERKAENTDGKDDADLAVGDDVTEGAHATA